MSTRKRQRTRIHVAEPCWANPRIEAFPLGELVLEAADFLLKLRLEDIDGRLRPALVEVLSKHPETVPVTPHVLATAPLAVAEAAANVPHVAAILRLGYEEASRRDELPLARIGGRRDKVVVPEERPYPQSFWRSVAAAYYEAVILEGARDPAVRIADEANAPEATVRAWIVRCRDQGLISKKGTRGRVG